MMTDHRRTKVLVALDGTEGPDATVATLRGTQPGQQDLVLLAVLPAGCPVEVSDRARRALAHVARRLETADTRVDSDVRLGETATEVVGAARNHNVDFIAMLRHSRPRIERWCLGAVVDDVVRSAPVPVLQLCPTGRGGVGSGARRPLRTARVRDIECLAPGGREVSRG